MNLHEFPNDFDDLAILTAKEKNISPSAVKRDYLIVLMLDSLQHSDFGDMCVFKGGTSLSKCYPNSINRFSEDIDLTFLGMDLSDKECDRNIKRIEAVMTAGLETRKIDEERSKRSKSMYVWLDSQEDKIKLEIGSNVRPDPFSKKRIKTYIQEYLEEHGYEKEISDYDLREAEINVLAIERTFIDKIMSVKRHALCNTLPAKTRHIYDVTRLFELAEIKEFLNNKDSLKRLVALTKQTDSYYLGKRNTPVEYNPVGPYDFPAWQGKLDADVRYNYENLHKTLLFTDEKQNFDKAIDVFFQINKILEDIGE